MRSSSVSEMVIRELIREYQMKFDSNISDLKNFNFGDAGALKDMFAAASEWLKIVLASAGGIFVYNNRNAIEGLGKVVAAKAKEAIIKTATAAVASNESRMLAEAIYQNRFNINVDSSNLEQDAKNMIRMISNREIRAEEIDISSDVKLKASLSLFNDGTAKTMKMIVDLCTNPARSYPNNLSTNFNVTGPALPNDIEDDTKKTAEYMMLDVASIQLFNDLIRHVLQFYDEVKSSIDKMYNESEKADENKKMTDILTTSFKTLSSNLDNIIGPAKKILVKS